MYIPMQLLKILSNILWRADKIIPWLAGISLALFAIGTAWGLFWSPQDYRQNDAVRIMYIHVPAAWMSLFCYTVMAVASALYLLRSAPTASLLAKVTAPLGAGFTVLALITGSLWGKITWGVWWVWDARVVSEFVLLLLYGGYMLYWRVMPQSNIAARNAAIVALVGFVNVPIVKFSVDWWNTLHQPASISRFAAPALDSAFLWPLLLMAGAFMVFYTALALVRLRTEILLLKITQKTLHRKA